MSLDEALSCLARRRGKGNEAGATSADVIMVEWCAGVVPALATLAHNTGGGLPILVIHGDSTVPSPLPLYVGAFAYLSLPLDPKLLEAKIFVFERLKSSASIAPSDLPEDIARLISDATPSVAQIGERPPAATLHHGPITIDLEAYEVRVGTAILDLPPRQFALLQALVRNAGRLVTRDYLLEHVWEIGFEVNTNVVDVYIHYLRKKLTEAGLAGVIETIRGMGYRLAIQSTDATS